MAKNKNMATDILDVVNEVTKDWKKTIKAEERSPSSRSFRHVRMTREKTHRLQGSGSGDHGAGVHDGERRWRGLPANARQIMYAARKHIQEVTGKPLVSSYFTQILLPDYCAGDRSRMGCRL